MSGEELGSVHEELAELAASDEIVVEATEEEEATIGVVAMRVGKRWFAVPAEMVREVVIKDLITRIPRTPPHMLGLTMVHGRLVPVVTLSKLFSAVEGGDSGMMLPRLVVIHNDDAEIAIVADEAHGVLAIPEPDAGDEAMQADHKSYVLGETEFLGELVCVLDVPELIAVVMGFGEH